MANDITGRTWLLDTAEAVWTGKVKIKSIRWVSESASAGNNVVVNDTAGNRIWSSVASGANFVDSDVLDAWFDGVTVATLDSGYLEVAIA